VVYSDILNESRLYCHIKYQENCLFFSLVDYRNNYFTNNDPNKIIEFYDGFDNREQLINWMRERPKGSSNIHEIEGENDIVVVITTADFDGKYAIDCRESIFKGLHIIFVESGGRGDFYFNYAHNVNVGIRKAIEYNPKWIVFSADDRYKIDDISQLTTELKLRDNSSTLLFPKFVPSSSFNHYVGRLNLLGKIVRSLITYSPIWRKKFWIYRTVRLKKLFVNNNFALPGILNNHFLTSHNRKYYYGDIEFVIFPTSLVVSYKDDLQLDEHYINGMEDHDFLLRLSLLKIPTEIVEFRIGLYYNSTLGATIARNLRDIIDIVYMSKKIESNVLNIKN